MNVDQTLAALNNVVDELVEKYCEPCKERDCDFCKIKLDSEEMVERIHQGMERGVTCGFNRIK